MIRLFHRNRTATAASALTLRTKAGSLASLLLLAIPMLHLWCFTTGRAKAVSLPLGSPLPGFHLMGTDGVVHSPNDWKESSVLVVAFLCNHCTESQVYEGRLNK